MNRHCAPAEEGCLPVSYPALARGMVPDMTDREKLLTCGDADREEVLLTTDPMRRDPRSACAKITSAG